MHCCYFKIIYAYEEVIPPNYCLDCLIPTEPPTEEHKLDALHASWMEVNAFLYVLQFLLEEIIFISLLLFVSTKSQITSLEVAARQRQ